MKRNTITKSISFDKKLYEKIEIKAHEESEEGEAVNISKTVCRLIRRAFKSEEK